MANFNADTKRILLCFDAAHVVGPSGQASDVRQKTLADKKQLAKIAKSTALGVEITLVKPEDITPPILSDSKTKVSAIKKHMDKIISAPVKKSVSSELQILTNKLDSRDKLTQSIPSSFREIVKKRIHHLKTNADVGEVKVTFDSLKGEIEKNKNEAKIVGKGVSDLFDKTRSGLSELDQNSLQQVVSPSGSERYSPS